MKNNAKYFLISFLLMLIFDLGVYYALTIPNFGGEINPHLGVLFISGLYFGPPGILGAVIANLICDIVKGYSYNLAILSEILSFLIAYLAYKLWYGKDKNTKPRLHDRRNMLSFFMIILTCGILYSLFMTKLTYLTYPNTLGLSYYIGIQYYVNFVNFSLIFGILGLGLIQIKDFSYTPKASEKKYSKKFYKMIGIVSILSCILIIISDIYLPDNYYYLNLFETLILAILVAIYTTKPIKKIENLPYVSIPEKIINRFSGITLALVVIGVISIFTPLFEYTLDLILIVSENQFYLLMLLILDLFVIVFLVPSYFIIRYVENKVVFPIVSFSKIESRIKLDEKIEINDLLDVYSKYSNQDDEIGMLSRSHIDLVEHNNKYIENIKKVESEKQRIQTELDIAHRIQEAILPSETIENENYKIKGYSIPAKEVGGDFYDYYEIDDEKLVIVIGDSSGKGVPAALFSTITQNSIEQHFIYEQNPAKILYDINNRICKNNSEFMFITLWLGVYNKKDKKLVFANAGHNRPLIKENDKYTELKTKSGIVLGISENFKFENEEIILNGDLIIYTDGITDARNKNKELYGEERLIKYLNQSKKEYIIKGLINDVETFYDGEDQYDDMTIVHLKTFK